jgi:hypothetical protein
MKNIFTVFLFAAMVIPSSWALGEEAAQVNRYVVEAGKFQRIPPSTKLSVVRCVSPKAAVPEVAPCVFKFLDDDMRYSSTNPSLQSSCAKGFYWVGLDDNTFGKGHCVWGLEHATQILITLQTAGLCR